MFGLILPGLARNVRITAHLARSQKCEQLFVSLPLQLQVKSTGPELQPAELQARNPEDRTIVLVLGPKLRAEPRFGAASQGDGAARTRTNV